MAMARKPSPLWRNSHLQDIVRPRVLWGLMALPLLGLLLSFVPWFVWMVPRAEARYPSPLQMTPETGLFFVTFLGLMVAGIVAGMWLGWRVNEWVCKLAFSWDADEVHRVFRESQLPARWLKPGLPSADATAAATRAAEIQLRGGIVAHVFKVGVLGWGLAMFLGMGLVPELLKDAPLQPRVLLIKALTWFGAGIAFGLVSWAFQWRTARKRQAPGAS